MTRGWGAIYSILTIYQVIQVIWSNYGQHAIPVRTKAKLDLTCMMAFLTLSFRSAYFNVILTVKCLIQLYV